MLNPILYLLLIFDRRRKEHGLCHSYTECCSRIGFEASNRYNFTRQNLMEELINIDYLKKFTEIKR